MVEIILTVTASIAVLSALGTLLYMLIKLIREM